MNTAAATVMPKYARACADGEWFVVTWNKKELAKRGVAMLRTTPYKCRSWRHSGECRRWRAAQNFSRLKATLDTIPRENMAFLVLTVDPKDYEDRWDAFSWLYVCWEKLRKRLQRWLGKDWKYVGTVETHRSGWPHLQVLLVGAPWRACRGSGWRSVRRELRPRAMDCGFGKVVWLEPVRSRDAVAGYCVKLAGELDGVHDGGESLKHVAEIAKYSQVPTNAPPNFRRLRASQKFLESPHVSNGERAGVLCSERGPLDDSAGAVVDLERGYAIRSDLLKSKANADILVEHAWSEGPKVIWLLRRPRPGMSAPKGPLWKRFARPLRLPVVEPSAEVRALVSAVQL